MLVRWLRGSSALTVAALLLAGCGSDDIRKAVAPSKVDPKYGVSASPRVADADRPRKGGGRYHVGKPYKIAGRWYRPAENPDYRNRGRASWYGKAFHGRLTANGEIFDMHSLSAAHTTMPLPSYARVTNVKNGHSVVVRVNDRGPFHGNRIIDVSKKAAELLGFKNDGIGTLQVEYVGRAPLDGESDADLARTARIGGRPMDAQRLAALGLPGGGTAPSSAVRVAAAPSVRPAVVATASAIAPQIDRPSVTAAPGAILAAAAAPSAVPASAGQIASPATFNPAPAAAPAQAFQSAPSDLWVGYFESADHASDFASLLSTYGDILLQPVWLEGEQRQQLYVRPSSPRMGQAALEVALGAGARHAKLVAR